MLKFRSEKDRVAFLCESNRIDLLDADPETYIDQVDESFFKKQRARILGLVDFRRSQDTKMQWRQNRWSMMKGIHSFHRSIKGKRFHRNLGRFLATTLFEPKKLQTLSSLRYECLKAISSAKTHMYIEATYYMSISEAVDHQILLDYSIPLLNSLEEKINLGDIDKITRDEFELVARLTETCEIEKALKYHSISEADLTQLKNANDETYFFCNLLNYKKDGYPSTEEG